MFYLANKITSSDSGSADTTINLWDTRSNANKPIQTLTEASDTVSSLHVNMPTYSIASGSYDGHVRVYDVRMGKTTVDVLAHPVTSVRCSADGNALLTSTLDSYIRMLDRTDGSLLAAFGGPSKKDEGPARGILDTKPRHTYRNTELRVRSVFAQGDAVVLSGSEAAPKGDGVALGAAVFAWDILSGETVATVPMGEDVKAVSCVAWNEKGYWAAGCADSKFHFHFTDGCIPWFWSHALTIVPSQVPLGSLVEPTADPSRRTWQPTSPLHLTS